jgi:hypothetical protein
LAENPRLSTTSSTDDEVQLDHLVVAQVHQHSALEIRPEPGAETEVDDEESADDLGQKPEKNL